MTTLEDLAKEAQAARDIIEDVSTILEDAGRSVVIEVINATSHRLRYDREEHEHGAMQVLPATTIEPFSANVFGSRSSAGGIATGTEGNVRYWVDDQGTAVRVRWNNPFAGTNEANINSYGPNKDLYAYTSQIAGGNKKVPARYLIAEKAQLTETEPDWRTCGPCKALFYALHEGKCPKNRQKMRVPDRPIGEKGVKIRSTTLHGAHQATGWVLAVPFGTPGPNREDGWRRCGRCKMLFWIGEFNNKKGGVCPSSSRGHEKERGGRQYLLPFDKNLRPRQQNDWRFCEKCFVLFYWPHNVDENCAAGGKHRPHAFNYILDVTHFG